MAGPSAIKQRRKEQKEERGIGASKDGGVRKRRVVVSGHGKGRGRGVGKGKPAGGVGGEGGGGRSKASVAQDILRGKAIAAAAKERRDFHRANATKAATTAKTTETAETTSNASNNTSQKTSNEITSSNASSLPDVKALAEQLRPQKKKRGGDGKKGKLFASTSDMLSIINSINSSEEVKIEKKLEKRRAVNALLDSKHEILKKKDGEKRAALEAKKKEILEKEKGQKKRKPVGEGIAEESKTKKKRVQFA